MSTSSTFAAALLAGVCPFLVAQEAPSSAKSAPADAAAVRTPANPPLVGIVDLAKAIEQYPRWIELQARLDGMEKQVRERMKQQETRLEDLKGAIQITNPDSDERRQAQFQLEMAQQERQWLAKTLFEKLDVENQRALLMVYEDLESAVPIVAKARGVMIVQRMHDLGPAKEDIEVMAPNTLQRRLRAFEVKQVWYAAPEVDLTADLIKYLLVPREDGKAGKAGKTDPGAGAGNAASKPGAAPQQGGK